MRERRTGYKRPIAAVAAAAGLLAATGFAIGSQQSEAAPRPQPTMTGTITGGHDAQGKPIQIEELRPEDMVLFKGTSEETIQGALALGCQAIRTANANNIPGNAAALTLRTEALEETLASANRVYDMTLNFDGDNRVNPPTQTGITEHNQFEEALAKQPNCPPLDPANKPR